jgi:hypothetical protein
MSFTAIATWLSLPIIVRDLCPPAASFETAAARPPQDEAD